MSGGRAGHEMAGRAGSQRNGHRFSSGENLWKAASRRRSTDVAAGAMDGHWIILGFVDSLYSTFTLSYSLKCFVCGNMTRYSILADHYSGIIQQSESERVNYGCA